MVVEINTLEAVKVSSAKTKKEVWSFLGLTDYYRCFIKECASMAPLKPLVMMTRSCTQRQPTEETTESGIVNDNVGSIFTEFMFDDEFFSYNKLTNSTQ